MQGASSQTEDGAPLGGAAVLGFTHSSGGAAASFGLRPTRLLEPTFGGAKRGALSAVTGIAEEGTGLRPPALGGLAVADAHEVTVRSRRCLIDAADAGRQAAA